MRQFGRQWGAAERPAHGAARTNLALLGDAVRVDSEHVDARRLVGQIGELAAELGAKPGELDLLAWSGSAGQPGLELELEGDGSELGDGALDPSSILPSFVRSA